MANPSTAVGFLHTGNNDGASPTFGQVNFQILSSDSNKIFQGDPVKFESTGYIGAWTASTAVSQLAGIFVGCSYQTATGLVRTNFWNGTSAGATADATATIIPCNLAVPPKFIVKAVGATGILFADIGSNVDVSMGTGSTVTGLSNAGAAQSTLDVTATLPFRVVGMGPAIGPDGKANDNTLANNWIYVVANVSGAGSTGI